MKQDIIENIKESITVKNAILADEILMLSVEKAVLRIVEAFSNGKAVYFCGNGGSAADAQHLSAEFSGRYKMERKALASEALNVNTSFLTAVANDYDFDRVFDRAVEAFCKEGDVLIALSTSGKSPNIINALKKASSQSVITIGFTGENGGDMHGLCDLICKVPSKNTPRIQESHLLIGHIICELVEKQLFANEK